MDVAIVGAGPAGAMAAISLARAGASVSLFDHSHPREKPCGGGLTGRAIGLVSQAIDLASLPAVVVSRASIESARDALGTPRDAEDAATIDVHNHGITPSSSLVVLSRCVFDRALLEAAIAAGSRLVAERVLDVEQGSRALRLVTKTGEHRADFVLGADGANSLVRKKLSRAFTRSQLSLAAGFFVRGATATDIAIKCLAEQPGYLWSFPRPDHLAIGICTPASEPVTSLALQRQAHAWIRSHGLDRATRLERYAWPIPSLSADEFARVCVTGTNWMLLGDAAGLVDPLTREGIYYALLSGCWAASALLAGSTAGLRHYEARVKDEMCPELTRAARLSRGFFRPEFSALLVEALGRNAAIRGVFVDLVGGHQPYRGLRRRLLQTGDVKTAAQFLKVWLTHRHTARLALDKSG